MSSLGLSPGALFRISDLETIIQTTVQTPESLSAFIDVVQLDQSHLPELFEAFS